MTRAKVLWAVVSACALMWSACGESVPGATCGDGVVEGDEICDDGNTADGDGCAGNCDSDETCGNGVVDLGLGEACDDGNTVDGDGCQASCALASCGDGVVDPAEVCDDGNTIDGDGCSATCMSDETCGNAVLDLAAGESCEDGNASDGDGCSKTCALEYCGNDTVDAGEVCDDGNEESGDGCSGDCQSNEVCGNQVVDVAAGENCDDGNTTDGDGCSATCVFEYCGNGISEAGEVCDDGGESATCDVDCTAPECGDGLVNMAAGESCENMMIETEVCDVDCTVPECGDGIVNTSAGEQCDDSNTVGGDGCDASCQDELPAACTTGSLGVLSGEPWTVCSATPNEIWVSHTGSGGEYDAIAICQSFGFSSVGQFGGTCGSVCGYCDSASTSCTNHGTKLFDGQNACAPPNLCISVMWTCLP